VRVGADLHSEILCSKERIATGALLEEMELKGVRLRYKKLTGEGPESGWVSIRMRGRDLLVRESPTDLSNAEKTPSERTTEVPSESDDSPSTVAEIPQEQAESCVSASSTESCPQDGGTVPTVTAIAAPLSPLNDAPRVFWTYWDQGRDRLPAFNRLCLDSWRRKHPQWKVEVIDRDSASSWLEGGDLPSTFNRMQMPQHRADCVKLAVLRRHGGIYMDSSIMVWQDLSVITGWRDIEDGNRDFAGYYLNSRDFVENYFLACRRSSSTPSTPLNRHFGGKDIERALVSIGAGRASPTVPSVPWKRAQLQRPPPLTSPSTNFADILFSILLKEEHSALVEEVFQKQVPLAKFTGHMSFLQGVPRSELLNGRNLLSRLMLRALDLVGPNPATVTSTLIP